MSEIDDSKIPVGVLDELIAAALALVVSFANIRAPVSTCLSATDATVRRAGACQAFVPQRVANACYRRSEHRGEYTRLRWSDFDIALRPSRMLEPGPDINQFAESLFWQDPVGYDFRRTEHINVQELKAAMDEVVRRISRGERDIAAGSPSI